MGRFLLAAMLGAGSVIIGTSAPAHAAPLSRITAPSLQSDHQTGIEPVYWTRDRFGRRVWVEERRFRPPPPRRGWVDRFGRWHPY